MLCGLTWDVDGDASAGDGSTADDTTNYFLSTMNATPYWYFMSSLQLQILCPSSMVVSPNPVHLILAWPRMCHQQHFNLWVSSCTFHRHIESGRSMMLLFFLLLAVWLLFSLQKHTYCPYHEDLQWGVRLLLIQVSTSLACCIFYCVSIISFQNNSNSNNKQTLKILEDEERKIEPFEFTE